MITKFTSFLLLSLIFTTISIIIILNSHQTNASNVKTNNNYDSILVKYKKQEQIQTIQISNNQDFKSVLENYQSNSMVEFAEPNVTYYITSTPNDKYYNKQWYLKRIKADRAWEKVNSSKDIVIAVIDTGVQINHPDLKDNIWINEKEIPNNNKDDDNNGYIDDYYGYDFINKVPNPSPKFSNGFTEDGITHGTLIAGILAASGNNGWGISGITWNTKIMPLKALDDKGQTNASMVIESINYAANHNVDIINLSFVGFDYSEGVQRAIRRAYDLGVIIVAAGGNEKGQGYGFFLDKTPMYPVCNDDSNGDNLVIGVASTGPLDQKSYFSSYGKCIDITAPGVSFYSTVPFSDKHNINGFPMNKFYDGYWSGTSFAVPLVSGTLALMQQASPNLSPQELTKLLMNSADNIDSVNKQFIGQLGSGRLNTQTAVNNAIKHFKETSTSLIFSPQSKADAKITILSKSGNEIKNFIAYKNFNNGVNISSGDVDNNGIDEIITAPKTNHSPEIKIFNQQGELLNSWLAYALDFKNGVQVTVGDVNNDGKDEIITAPGIGHSPEIKIFNQQGELLNSWLAYAPDFKNGVNLTVGDVNGNGIFEIVTAPLSNGGPHIRIFNYNGKVLNQFFAYDKNIRNGFQVAVAHFKDYRKNGGKIIVSANAGMAPYIKIFNPIGELKWKFGAYEVNFAGGVNLTTGDINNDGLSEIITSAGAGGSPHIRIFKNYGLIVDSFFVGDKKFNGGLMPAIITNSI